MKSRKAEVYILSLLLLATVLLCAFWEPDGQPDFSFRAGGETIRILETADGNGIVFLPSYVDLNQLRLYTKHSIFIDGAEFTYGKACGNLNLNTGYHVTGAEGLNKIVFLKSQNIPTVFIDTASGSMEFIHEDKENEERGIVRLYNERGKQEIRGNLDSIKARGNSSFYSLKKPYSLEFSEKQDILGMGAVKKWILLANADDATHIKNKLVFDFAKTVGLQFSPESRWVDLYLNGEYAGLCLICERNEIDSQRISIPGGKGSLVSKEQVYNLMDYGKPFFTTEAGVSLRIHSNNLDYGQMKQIFQSAENAVLAKDGVDPLSGRHWSELIDMESWAKKYLIEEIFGGIDAGIASQFFYVSPDYDGGKIYAGPVWEYDDTMGTPITLEEGMPSAVSVPEMFYAHRSRDCQWFHSLYYNSVFYDCLTKLYRENFAKSLQEVVDKRIPQYEGLINQASRLNQIRWDTESQQKAIREMQNYLTDRVKFLNQV